MFFRKDPKKEAEKQKIKIVREAISMAGGELIAWGDNLCVQYKNNLDKEKIINILTPLGWKANKQSQDDLEAMVLDFFSVNQ